MAHRGFETIIQCIDAVTVTHTHHIHRHCRTADESLYVGEIHALPVAHEVVAAAEAEQALEEELLAAAEADLAEQQQAYKEALDNANENELDYAGYADQNADAKEALDDLEQFIEDNKGNLSDPEVVGELQELLDKTEDAIDELTEKSDELLVPEVVAGDINKDGQVDADDLALFINALYNDTLPTDPESEEFIRYNANGDKIISIADAQAIFNMALGRNADGSAK